MSGHCALRLSYTPYLFHAADVMRVQPLLAIVTAAIEHTGRSANAPSSLTAAPSMASSTAGTAAGRSSAMTTTSTMGQAAGTEYNGGELYRLAAVMHRSTPTTRLHSSSSHVSCTTAPHCVKAAVAIKRNSAARTLPSEQMIDDTTETHTRLDRAP